MTPDPQNIVGATEIAERAGVSPVTVHKWRSRHPNFPPPLVQLSIGPVWYWPNVRRWLRETGRGGEHGR